MESILNSLTGISNPKEAENVVIDLGPVLSVISDRMNLLPSDHYYPDEEELVKLILSAAVARFNPALQVIQAKVNNIYSNVDANTRNEILACLLTGSLFLIETFNKLDLWSPNGYAMYEFDSFLNDNSVILKKVSKFKDY